MKHRLLSLVILSIMLLSLSGCHTKDQELVITEPIGEMNVTVLEAGKADATVITTENHTVVIDTGLNKFGEQLSEYLSTLGRDTIDYLIITHFDKDHVGGADTIIENFDVKHVLQPNYTSDSKQYEQYTKALSKKGITPTILTKDLSFTLDEASFTVNPPQKSYYGKDEENDFSLVTTIVHGNNRFLFAGDAEELRLQELIQQGNLKAQFLKVPYHGRVVANSQKFLNEVSPQYAVITCSEEEPAAPEIIDSLNHLGTKTYETVNGEVTCVSNGISLVVNQTK